MQHYQFVENSNYGAVYRQLENQVRNCTKLKKNGNFQQPGAREIFVFLFLANIRNQPLKMHLTRCRAKQFGNVLTKTPNQKKTLLLCILPCPVDKQKTGDLQNTYHPSAPWVYNTKNSTAFEPQQNTECCQPEFPDNRGSDLGPSIKTVISCTD